MADAPRESLMPSSSRPEPPRRPTQRLPAPSLFVGPPSRNASATSLLLSTTTTHQSSTTTTPSANLGSSSTSTSTPLPSTSHLSSAPPRPTLSHRHTSSAGGAFLADAGLDPHLLRPRDAVKPSGSAPGVGGKQKLDAPDATEAQWKELQSTLEEVELSAQSGAHVFGSGHAEALEALRRAQVELASAWARGEGEEMADGGGEEGSVKGKGTASSPQSKRAEESGGGRSQLEEEAEADIVLARKRREANDRYFARVNAGVMDVVAKLDEVARAMRGVEMESKEIWGERDSIDTGSVMS